MARERKKGESVVGKQSIVYCPSERAVYTARAYTSLKEHHVARVREKQAREDTGQSDCEGWNNVGCSPCDTECK